jgi:hypothetical protein
MKCILEEPEGLKIAIAQGNALGTDSKTIAA